MANNNNDPLSLVPFLFGSAMRGLSHFITPENWQAKCDEIFNWCVNKAMTLHERETSNDDVPNGKPPKPPEPVKYISPGQARRFWAIAKANGWTNEGMLAFFQTHNVLSTDKIPAVSYNTWIKILETPGEAAKYNPK